MIRILVTNDDGIDAPGLQVLAAKLAEHAEVYVAAPATQQSGKSQSITFWHSVGVKKREMDCAVEAYAVDGTPADCVIWGLGMLASKGIRPDYVFSGINMGPNMGLAAYYSGTIAAAREGAINGVKSVALSLCSHEAVHYDYILGMIPQILEMSDAAGPATIVSVNAPEIPSWEVKGVRVVPAAPYGYGEYFVFKKLRDDHYLMEPAPARRDGEMRYDYDWVEAGYATISPIPTGIQDPQALMRLRGQTESSEYLAVIVDAQETVAGEVKKADKFRRNVGKFAHCMSRMGIPTIICETYGQGNTIEEVSAFAKEAETVERQMPDPWSSPEMERLAGAVDAERVVIAGALTNVAVKDAAFGFLSRGFSVTIAEDCCAATSKQNRKLAAEELRAAGCNLCSSESVIMELASCCTKQVLDAVREILCA